MTKIDTLQIGDVLNTPGRKRTRTVVDIHGEYVVLSANFRGENGSELSVVRKKVLINRGYAKL